jgi:3-oxoacyl-[acyl-carrier-protein] synthase-3
MSNELEIGIESISYSLGKNVCNNIQLQEENPTWDMSKILERTGVESRAIASKGETALDLAIEATEKLLNNFSIDINSIDALIFCTQTPDYLLPPNSCLLHGKFNMSPNVMSFDINHACSGFIYSIGIARGLLASKMAKKILVINSDTYSHLIHPLDRSIRPLFGDAATATLIKTNCSKLRILDISFGTSGVNSDRFIVKNGGFRHSSNDVDLKYLQDKSGRINSPNHIYMDGMGVLSFFNNIVPIAINEILLKNNRSLDDVSLFIFHQASKLALDSIARSLKIPSFKMVVDMLDTGNLVSASIPVVLGRSIDKGLINENQLIVICGFGVGLSWGVALIES